MFAGLLRNVCGCPSNLPLVVGESTSKVLDINSLIESHTPTFKSQNNLPK